MTVTRALALRLSSLLAGLALATTACGGGGSSTAADPAPTSSLATSTSPGDSSPSGADLSGEEQLIRVTKYGVGFALPKGWSTLDATNVLGADNPALQEFAQHMGTTTQQVVTLLKNNVQTLSISDEGAHDGFVDNVNSIGTAAPSINDDQIKLQLAAIGAKLGPIVHADSPAGAVTRVPYHWTNSGRVIQVQLIIVDVGRELVSITASSVSADSAAQIGDQIQQSLQSL